MTAKRFQYRPEGKILSRKRPKLGNTEKYQDFAVFLGKILILSHQKVLIKLGYNQNAWQNRELVSLEVPICGEFRKLLVGGYLRIHDHGFKGLPGFVFVGLDPSQH